jgi:hypothetical protein
MSGMGPGIGMRSISQAKAGFFDRAAVIGAVDAMSRRVLSKFGAYVRQSARTSIRKRKAASAVGSPPSSHVGLLRKFILFSWDAEKRSVVIGAALLNGRAYRDTPSVLEYGGRAMRRNRSGPYVATYKPRPFMGPAFTANLPKLPGMWANALKP